MTAHANMLRFLMPRWHGDFRQMGAFVDERAAAVPDEPALGLLLLRLAQDAVDAGARLDAERLRLVDDAFERLHAAYPKWRLACRERVRLALSLKDDASAARWTIAGAEAGDAGLANDAGRLLMTGAFGTERDPERAVRFLCRAAHAGWVPAMEGLATAFARGDGVPASPEVAEAWRQAAAAAREAQRRAR